MEKLRASSFVGHDTLELNEEPGAGIFFEGEIACLGGIIVSVEKFLAILEGDGPAAVVQTDMYSYNAFVRNGHNILRYDNQHPWHLRPGHPDEHHKHVFDWQTGEELINSPVWVGADKWPTLGETIGEVERWYYNNIGDLSEPGEYPKLGLRD